MFVNYVKSALNKDQAVILEAGAYSGSDTIRLSGLWPFGTIYAFEPNPHWHNSLKNIAASHPNIVFYPAALDAKTGEMDFFLSSDMSGCDSIFPPDLNFISWKTVSSSARFDNIVKVPVWNLDEWAHKNQIEQIDFIRFDMQGAEGCVLQACPEILKTVSFVQLEFLTSPIYTGAILYPEIIQILQQQGFVLLKSVEEKYWGDALFKKK
jgi:FkbM family methyltransferase